MTTPTRFSGATLVAALLTMGIGIGCPTTAAPGAPETQSPEPEAPGTPVPDTPVPDVGEPAVPEPEDAGVELPDAGPALDERPANPACLAPERPVVGANVNLTRVFPSLSWLNAIELLQAPGDNSAFYVVLKSGTVEKVANEDDPTTTEVFLDLTDRVYDVGGTDERGLLGMAFHPQYPAVQEIYVNYVGQFGGGFSSVVARIPLVGGVPDRDQEDVLLTLGQPAGNHNGGDVKFGPDGYLYVSFGDGGSAGDFFGHGQRSDTLLATIIRIDVDSPPSPDLDYRIPDDNPFVNGGGAPEVFAYGLRNVWRMAFDPFSGALWAADVGQNAFEEVNVIESAGNYGWPVTEGFHCYDAATCDFAPYSAPEVEYPHSEGRSITGGYVYRGNEIPGLLGVYVFGDFVTGALFGAFVDPDGGYEAIRLGTSTASIASFGEDEAGNIYILGYQSGIFRLDAGGEPPENPVPGLLSETGCVDVDDPTQFAPGVIPYDINVPFWSDSAAKQRAFAIPDGTTISVNDEGDFEFPIGSVTLKTFFRGQSRIETRLFVRHDDGGWGGYVYRWREDQSNADLLEVGVVDDVPGGPWAFPSRGTCLQCHSEVEGRTLGLQVRQLNRSLTYPQTGRRANQLRTLDAVGFFDGIAPEPRPTFVSPLGDAGLDERARTYLHVNCAACHQPNGPVQTEIDLRYAVTTDLMRVCNEDPSAGTLEIPGAKIIDGSQPSTSVLYERLGRRDVHGMPPLASLRVDDDGQNLIREWIESGVCDDVTPPPPPVLLGSCENPETLTLAAGFGTLVLDGDTAGRENTTEGSCGQATGGEWVVSIVSDVSLAVCINSGSSDFDTYLHARTTCDAVATEVACNDDEDNPGGIYTSEIAFDVSPTEVFLVVDGYDSNGEFGLEITEGACP